MKAAIKLAGPGKPYDMKARERSSCWFMFPIVEGLTPCSEEIGIDWMGYP